MERIDPRSARKRITATNGEVLPRNLEGQKLTGLVGKTIPQRLGHIEDDRSHITERIGAGRLQVEGRRYEANRLNPHYGVLDNGVVALVA